MALFPLSLKDYAQPNVPGRDLPPSNRPLDLLLADSDPVTYRKFFKIGGTSVVIHAVLFLLGLQLPSFIPRNETAPTKTVVEHHTPLYFPRELVTQRAKNRGQLSKQIDLASLLAEQNAQASQSASPTAGTKHFEMPKDVGTQANAKGTPQIVADAPTLALNQPPTDTPGMSNGLPPVAPPPIPAPRQLPLPPAGAPAPPPTPGQIVPQEGASRAVIELKSDPQGADFKPYIARILAIINANWERVRPQNARGGRTIIEVVINRDGTMPRFVTTEPSGSNRLDYAAASSLSMSNPLPPLPPEYKGFQVRIAFTFDYRMPVR